MQKDISLEIQRLYRWYCKYIVPSLLCSINMIKKKKNYLCNYRNQSELYPFLLQQTCILTQTRSRHFLEMVFSNLLYKNVKLSFFFFSFFINHCIRNLYCRIKCSVEQHLTCSYWLVFLPAHKLVIAYHENHHYIRYKMKNIRPKSQFHLQGHCELLQQKMYIFFLIASGYQTFSQ